MTCRFSATVPVRPLLEPVELPLLVRWHMTVAGARTGWGRQARRLVKAAFRLVHQRLRVPAKARLRLQAHDRAPVFSADMANTAYMQVLLAERGRSVEPELAALIAVLADRLDTVYDIGANCGLFSARLATEPGFRGQVHAFEMIPATCRSMIGMVEECGLSDRVSCYPFGLSAADGSVRVQVGMHSTLARIAAGERGNACAEVRALDGLALPSPDLMKIDVEGHEDQVLAGASDTLLEFRPHVVFESWYLPTDRAAMTAPFDRLAEVGYRFFTLRCERADPGTARLWLKPVTPKSRSGMPEQLNVLAVHEDRLGELGEAFDRSRSGDDRPSSCLRRPLSSSACPQLGSHSAAAIRPRSPSRHSGSPGARRPVLRPPGLPARPSRATWRP